MFNDAVKMVMEQVEFEDKRQQHKVKYPIAPTLIAILLAWMAGANSAVAAAMFWKMNASKLRMLIPNFPDSNISHDTINRILSCIVVDNLLAFLRDFCNKILEGYVDYEEDSKRILSLDGQTPRAIEYEPKEGSLGISRDDQRIHSKIYFVTLYDSGNGLALAQEEVLEKENENKACSRLIEMFDLKGCVVTADALNTQRSIVEKILENGGDYVLALKNNHKSLCTKIKEIFEDSELLREYGKTYDHGIELGHGRIEQRIVTAMPANLIGKPSLGAWAKDCCTVFKAVTYSTDKKYGTSRKPEIRYFVSSLAYENTNIEKLGYRAIREHWHVENKLHWCLDMDFGQDHMQIKNRNYLRNVLILNKISLNTIKALQPFYQEGSTTPSIPNMQIMFQSQPDKMLLQVAKLFAREEIKVN